MRNLRARSALVAVLLSLAACADSRPVDRGDPHGSSQEASALRHLDLTRALADGSLDVYFLGDSITAGYNAATMNDGYMPVAVALLKNQFPVSSSSDYRAGAIFQEMLRLTGPPEYHDVTVIALGTNNARLGSSAVDSFTSSFTTYISSVSQLGGALICIGVFNASTVGAAIDAIIAESCESSGGRFISIADLSSQSRFVAMPDQVGYPQFGDGHHPNSEGHSEIAARLVSAVDEVVSDD